MRAGPIGRWCEWIFDAIILPIISSIGTCVLPSSHQLFCMGVVIWSYTTVPTAFRPQFLCVFTNFEVHERYLPIIRGAGAPFPCFPRHCNFHEAVQEHLTCKVWVTRCWCSYLPGARCRLLAYGPADATASQKTPSSLALCKTRLVFTARCYASAVLAMALCLSVRHKSVFY